MRYAGTYLPPALASTYVLTFKFICSAEETPTPELSNCVAVTDLLAFTSGLV